MLKQIEGSRAVAETVAMCRPQVICAYPITPQTHIVEALGAMVKKGELNAEFLNVESEFAARHRGHLLTVPATNLAVANLGRPLPGAPMLGGFAALTRTEQAVSLDALLAAITERFGDRPRVAAGNAAAARAAFDFVTGKLDELKAVTHHA